MCMNEGPTNRWVTIACAMAFIAGTVSTLKEANAQDDAKQQRIQALEKRVQELRNAEKELEQEKQLQGDFNQRLGGEIENELGQQGGMTVVMNEDDNGTSYSVRIENGKTTAERDGKALSKDEYRVRGGKVEFLDKNGDVEHTMQLPTTARGGRGAGNVWQMMPRGANPRAFTLQGDPVARAGQAATPPPVMLGITMSDDNGGATIDSVRDDLPADKAGMKAGDVIVEIDGKQVKGQSDVRSVLKKYKDGDKVDVIVLRDGDKKTLHVELAAWDAKALGQDDGGAMAWTVPGVPQAPDAPDPFNGDMSQWWRNFSQGLGSDSKEALTSAREALEAALEQVDAAKDNIEDLRKAAKDGLEAAITSLKEAEEKASTRHGVRLLAPNQNGGAQTLVLPDLLERERVRGTRDHDDEVRKQLDEVREQLKELRKQMEENSKKKDGK